MVDKFYSAKRLEEHLEKSIESQMKIIDGIVTSAGYKRVCTESLGGAEGDVVLCAKDAELYLVKIKDSKICEATKFDSEVTAEEFAIELLEAYVKDPEAAKAVLE